jgi:2-polyprenyl-3-methyl-5-hydroxy-6-metoxy-1,4-benzoquinol methylase
MTTEFSSSHPACPLCAGDRTAAVFEKSGRQYWRCRTCTLLFARAATNANFQAIDDFEPAYLQYLDDGPADVRNLDDIIGWIESHVSLRSPSCRLLDVGAGGGKLVRRLRQTRSCAVSALEPSATLFARYGLGALGVDPITLPELASRRPDPFDVVTVLDVVEHAPDAAGFLAALASVTRAGGYVFLSTPDAGSLLARLLGRRWHHCNPYHFSLYGRRAMLEAASRHGFAVVAAEHRPKRVPIDYLWNYARDFLFRLRPRSRDYHPSRITIPVSLGDILYVVWKRLPD